MRENLKAVTVNLGDLDIDIVQEEEALDGSNFSAALRKIIREWARSHSSNRRRIIDANAAPKA